MCKLENLSTWILNGTFFMNVTLALSSESEYLLKFDQQLLNNSQKWMGWNLMILPLLRVSPIPVQVGLCVQVLQEQLIVLPQLTIPRFCWSRDACWRTKKNEWRNPKDFLFCDSVIPVLFCLCIFSGDWGRVRHCMGGKHVWNKIVRMFKF